MNRLLHALLALTLLLLGVFLFVVPWRDAWEHNYFLVRYPELIRILLHPAVRGAISGLGVLDILVGFGMLRTPVAHKPAGE